jgi:hypothetical protein
MGEPHFVEQDQLRREYSRVEAYIPFEYRILEPQEREYIHARISPKTIPAEFRPIPDGGNQDNLQEEWLKIINFKLDTVIRLLTLQREGYFGLPYKAVNISGGGMGFHLPEPVRLDDLIEIKLVFTLTNFVALCVYGEVVKVEAREGHYFTAVHFVQLDEMVRNEIIRFVFEREREIIREKRG